MPFQIGTDEAGYGPNLGPLVVSGTSWLVPSEGVSLYECLRDIVTRIPTPDYLPIADSKQLYKSTASMATLEFSALAIVRAHLGRLPTHWLELTELLCGDGFARRLPSEIWLADQQLELPLANDPQLICRAADRFRDACDRNGIQLVSVRCVPIFPGEFNDQVEELGNKAELLTKLTLKIVHALLSGCGDAWIVCDKHGGRNRYAALLQQYVTSEFVRVHHESLAQSRYAWTENGVARKIDFLARGESFMPTALASMLSKYLREVFMRLWNSFWQSRLPSLRPTQGYPNDARRFKQEIAAAQAALQIADRCIWRQR